MAATSSLVNEAIFPTLQKVGSVPVLRDCMTDDIVMEGYHGCESLGMLLSRSFQELQYEMLTCQHISILANRSRAICRFCHFFTHREVKSIRKLHERRRPFLVFWNFSASGARQVLSMYDCSM